MGFMATVENLKARIVALNRNKGGEFLLSFKSSVSLTNEHVEGVLNAAQGLVRELRDAVHVIIDTIKVEL